MKSVHKKRLLSRGLGLRVERCRTLKTRLVVVTICWVLCLLQKPKASFVLKKSSLIFLLTGFQEKRKRDARFVLVQKKNTLRNSPDERGVGGKGKVCNPNVGHRVNELPADASYTLIR